MSPQVGKDSLQAVAMRAYQDRETSRLQQARLRAGHLGELGGVLLTTILKIETGREPDELDIDTGVAIVDGLRFTLGEDPLGGRLQVVLPCALCGTYVPRAFTGAADLGADLIQGVACARCPRPT